MLSQTSSTGDGKETERELRKKTKQAPLGKYMNSTMNMNGRGKRSRDQRDQRDQATQGDTRSKDTKDTYDTNGERKPKNPKQKNRRLPEATKRKGIE